MAESFSATIKKELIHLHAWPALSKVKKEVFYYIEVYYNRKRPHSIAGPQRWRPSDDRCWSARRRVSGRLRA